MLVHGYRQVLRLARLPSKPNVSQFVETTREKGSQLLDLVTVHTQKGIAVTETVVERAVDLAPRPSREALAGVYERVVRFAPRLAGRSVEVALMAATAVAAVVLAVALVNGLRSASVQVIDVVNDAVSSALTQLEFDGP